MRIVRIGAEETELACVHGPSSGESEIAGTSYSRICLPMHPVLFSIGRFDFFTAPLFAGLSALAAYLYYARFRPAGLTDEEFWELMFGLAVGVIVGGLVLYCFAYGNGLASNLRTLFVRRRNPGGSFFGSLLGAAVVLLVFSRARGKSFARLADPLGPASLLGLSVMRVGCLLHGCCHGRPTDLPWGIVFTDPRCNVRNAWLGRPLHPTQVYEAAGSLLIALLVHRVFLRRVRDGRAPEGSAFAWSAGLYAVMRFGLDFLRGGDAGLLTPLGLTTSQLLSLAVLAAIAAVTRLRTYKPA